MDVILDVKEDLVDVLFTFNLLACQFQVSVFVTSTNCVLSSSYR